MTTNIKLLIIFSDQFLDTLQFLWVGGISEYFAKKISEKISPYLLLSEVENCQKLHLFWEKLQKFVNLGMKIEKMRVKSIKICIFGEKVFPLTYSFPPPYFYLAE